MEVLSAGWAEYTNTDYGQGQHTVVTYRDSTRTINDIISEANQNSEITHIVRNREHWFLCRTGGFVEGPKSWCTLWIKNEKKPVSWTVYNDYNINGGAFWDGAPITESNTSSGDGWVLQSEYTLDEVKAFIGDTDVFIIQVGDGTQKDDRYYIRINDRNNKLRPKSEPATVHSYVKSSSIIEYH